MALKNNWKTLVDGVDDASAEQINQIAEAVIDSEDKIGDIDTALDRIIAIQESFVPTATLPGEEEVVS